MFRNLARLSYERSALQAVGFYFAYLLVIVGLSALMGGVAGLSGGDFEYGRRLGNLTAIVICLALSIAILQQKGRLAHFGFLLVVLLSGVLAMLAGGLGGLIPVAFLTTRQIATVPTVEVRQAAATATIQP